MKLADQAIDSKEYVNRYLAYTKSPTVQYESMMANGDAVSDKNSSCEQDSQLAEL